MIVLALLVVAYRAARRSIPFSGASGAAAATGACMVTWYVAANSPGADRAALALFAFWLATLVWDLTLGERLARKLR